jgi:hypothetical protein
MRRNWGAGEGKILLNCSGGTVNWLDFFGAHFFLRKSIIKVKWEEEQGGYSLSYFNSDFLEKNLKHYSK